jgi:hypothetical protein
MPIAGRVLLAGRALACGTVILLRLRGVRERGCHLPPNPSDVINAVLRRFGDVPQRLLQRADALGLLLYLHRARFRVLEYLLRRAVIHRSPSDHRPYTRQ